jgi:hypothetical protein
MAGQTQEALYAEIDLELSWSEDELPQVERTKHVHSLHPYLGKFIPQLVEVFLRRYFSPGDVVYDPFVGSGTTLVESNVFGCEAIGVDISGFNCLLCQVKTSVYPLIEVELSLAQALEEARQWVPLPREDVTVWLRDWYSDQALEELLAYREAARAHGGDSKKVAYTILSRAARSARMTTHYDLDFPRQPIRGPYYCLKHKRTCRPVEEAGKFLQRYTRDAIRRLREFSAIRSEQAVTVLHDDARTVELSQEASGIITSPPYPGLIDYHEQHRYAYELLGLQDRRTGELGRAERGTGRSAIEEYVDGMVAVFQNARRFLPAGAPVVIVVNDSRDLYPQILRRASFMLEERLTRHVNRRTGRRAGQFFEDVLVCSSA